MPRRRSPSQLLNPARPVAWEYPLNRWLAGEWAVSPLPRNGSGILYDLVCGSLPPSNGTLTNGVTWSGPADRPGGYGALSFNASLSQYVSIPDTASLNFSGNFSLAAWVLNTNGTSGYKTVVGKDAPESITHAGWQLRIGSNLSLLLEFGNGSGIHFLQTAANVVDATHWWFIAGTWDGSSFALYAYCPATGAAGLVGSGAGSGSGTMTPGTGAADLGFKRTGDDVYYGGLIDEAMAFSRALTAGEVYALYDQTRRGNPDRWNWQRAGFAQTPTAAVVEPYNPFPSLPCPILAM